MDPNTVIERLGEGFLWANLRHVLRCKACGERPYVVQIVANAGGGV